VHRATPQLFVDDRPYCGQIPGETLVRTPDITTSMSRLALTGSVQRRDSSLTTVRFADKREENGPT
jgi:hypothetical protein